MEPPYTWLGAGGTPATWHPLELEEHPVDAPRHLKAIVVGAGITGINAAILLPAKVPGLELVVFERAAEVGGIWEQCKYPGVRCDVPSHVYQSTFAPSRDWSEHYAQGAEIQAYWADVAKKYDAYRYIRFRHEVLSAAWDAKKTQWVVRVRVTTTDAAGAEESKTVVETADFFIVATGVFSQPRMPDIPGLDAYRGHLVHSSRWDPAFDPAGKTIAIIGNGSSGMQLLPPLQQVAARIDHYARSPAWVAGTNFGGIDGDPGDRIPDYERAAMQDPAAYLRYRKTLEERSFRGFGSLVKDGAASQAARARYTALMKERLDGRPDLLAAILPNFAPSCRRLTPGPGYLEALVEPNVAYITTPIARLTAAGVCTTDGVERAVDAVVCCTGADSSFAPPFPIVVGSTGGGDDDDDDALDLATAWRAGGRIGFPYTYLGLAVPGCPNLLFVNGAQCAAATGTLPFATENQLTLVARILRKAAAEDIATMAPSRQATDDFQAYCEAYFPRTVLADGCRSWFNGGEAGGRVRANWPGSGLHANWVRRAPRWEDWDYTYRTPTGNRFAYWGTGWTERDVAVGGGGLTTTTTATTAAESHTKDDVDLTPYLQLASIDGTVDLRAYHETWYDA